MRVRLTARSSNLSIITEINPEYSLEGLMLKLKLLILWPSDVKSRLIGKDPDEGKNSRQKEKGAAEDEIESITTSVDMNLSQLWEIVKDKEACCAAGHGVANRLSI